MIYKYTETKQVVNKIEILPCPFCGSENVKPIHIKGNYGYSPSEDYVACLSCGATGGKIKDSDCGNYMQEAVNNWNERAK